MKDPIVKEIHEYRKIYAKRFNNDSKAMYEDLKAKEAELKKQGLKFVSLSPKRPSEEKEAA